MSGGAGEELTQWREADRLLDELLELPAAEREKELAARSLPTAVRDKVERLPVALGDEEGLVDRSAPTLVVELARRQVASPDTDSSRLGAQFGPYRVVEEIGRRGMSVVFRAERIDGHFEQDVALKILTGTGRRGRRRERVSRRRG